MIHLAVAIASSILWLMVVHVAETRAHIRGHAAGWEAGFRVGWDRAAKHIATDIQAQALAQGVVINLKLRSPEPIN